jgi:hypothetical protein
VLVVGTGEFVYLPFRLAEQLEHQGADVFCQATTRSPIRIGAAIRWALTFPDHCEDGIPNFLYNAGRDQYDRIFVVYETPPRTAVAELLEPLGAEPVFLGPE